MIVASSTLKNITHSPRPLILQKLFSQTNAFYHSFIPDTIRTWDNLPENIVCMCSKSELLQLHPFFNQLIFAMCLLLIVFVFYCFQYLFFTQLRVNCNCYSRVHLTISLLLFVYPLLCINFRRKKKRQLHELALSRLCTFTVPFHIPVQRLETPNPSCWLQTIASIERSTSALSPSSPFTTALLNSGSS